MYKGPHGLLPVDFEEGPPKYFKMIYTLTPRSNKYCTLEVEVIFL